MLPILDRTDRGVSEVLREALATGLANSNHPTSNILTVTDIRTSRAGDAVVAEMRFTHTQPVLAPNHPATLRMFRDVLCLPQLHNAGDFDRPLEVHFEQRDGLPVREYSARFSRVEFERDMRQALHARGIEVEQIKHLTLRCHDAHLNIAIVVADFLNREREVAYEVRNSLKQYPVTVYFGREFDRYAEIRTSIARDEEAGIIVDPTARVGPHLEAGTIQDCRQQLALAIDPLNTARPEDLVYAERLLEGYIGVHVHFPNYCRGARFFTKGQSNYSFHAQFVVTPEGAIQGFDLNLAVVNHSYPINRETLAIPNSIEQSDRAAIEENLDLLTEAAGRRRVRRACGGQFIDTTNNGRGDLIVRELVRAVYALMPFYLQGKDVSVISRESKSIPTALKNRIMKVLGAFDICDDDFRDNMRLSAMLLNLHDLNQRELFDSVVDCLTDHRYVVRNFFYPTPLRGEIVLKSSRVGEVNQGQLDSYLAGRRIRSSASLRRVAKRRNAEIASKNGRRTQPLGDRAEVSPAA